MKNSPTRTTHTRTRPHGKLAEPLQQIDRTCVLHRGRKLTYFAGCDYFRLASHPRLLAAIHDGLDEFGLNVAASRKTTGNHPLYAKLEESLAGFFGADTALVVSNGYITNAAVGQALAGEFRHVLIDECAHGSLHDAARMLDAPITTFSHRDPAAATTAATRILKRLPGRSKLLLATDGLYSHTGEVAPLHQYLQRLPSNVSVLVDDAHGAGILGRSGRGTAEYLGVKPQSRLIQTVTLSKAFGVYGGAILGPSSLRQKAIDRSRLFAGNTPLPLPLAAGALTAIEIVRENPTLRRRLYFNSNYVKSALREAGYPIPDGPGPIVSVRPDSPREVTRLKQRLLKAAIHPPYINYLGGPNDGYFRFVISSEHTAQQLDALVHALAESS